MIKLFIIYKFKDRIKELCGQYGISQKFLCDQIGKQKTYFNDVWRGRCTPTDADLQTISGHLHTTPAYLRGEIDTPEPPADEGDWVDEIKISPAKLAFAKRLAEMDDSLASALSGLPSLDTATLLKLEKILDMILEEK